MAILNTVTVRHIAGSRSIWASPTCQCRYLSTSLVVLADTKPAKKTNRFAQRFNNQHNSQQQNLPKTPPNNRPAKATQHGPPKSGLSRAPSASAIPPARADSRKDQYAKAKETLRQKQTYKPKPKRKVQAPKEKIKVSVPTFVSVSNLSTILRIPLNSLLKTLEAMGFDNMRHNYILDKDSVSLVADEYGFEVNMNDDTGLDLFPAPPAEDISKLKARAPIVTIMGHVDHGKTTILDYLRKSSIVDKEFGGITQHIGAFSVVTPISKKKITFLDTPGHAAFLKMRERGANVTDIVILVVAADDSVMPQTLEAIKHAKNAGVPVIVAINKCDKQGLKIDKVLADLARYEVDIEDYGGETQTVQVSGKTGLGMDKLEEAVITLSEINEFKAEPTGVPSEGSVIESEVVKGMGPISTVLVTRGTVKIGDFLVAGTTYCKVRGMKDENGKPIKVAGPSTPAQIWGWKELPESGDQILQAKTEQIAKKVCDNRITRNKQMEATKDIESINLKRQLEIDELKKQEKINELKLQGFTEEDLREEFFGDEKKVETVKYIIRADVTGSAEAIKESIEGLGNELVKATVISYEAGPPADSDVDMAGALGANIFCFNLKVPKPTLARASRAGVSIKEHNIIYRLIEDVTEDLSSKLPPIIETKILAELSIMGVFSISNKNKKSTKVAGCKVGSGIIKRSSRIRVLRKDKVIFDGALSSLKQVKDDVSEVKKGQECGLTFDSWEAFEEGDQVLVYEEISHKQYL
ncbi:initiation factor 2 [Yamadazyma tenuis ATCC 10573]|uniref:Translation initiation factor IF-2, mitochondrial n=1 Tax=Candida tenuis (strain ATCC 10573 / BCRC 21748 / CBS 615 / JCM 9827 / NBRC 10315 / NRRL Y-1498 / VKM Y-70) TaxID=590646 RepID=G3B009_CANTC|nr:initiation factor 2 [Yamadazyma tenuis ATCC 10573]EGV65286.1 initiation factor 2 [Yamadazyma tenuis ATCC 10573]